MASSTWSATARRRRLGPRPRSRPRRPRRAAGRAGRPPGAARGLGTAADRHQPVARCQETAAPLAARWGGAARRASGRPRSRRRRACRWAARVAWLRDAMAGEWAELGALHGLPRRRRGRVAAMHTDTVVVSHFVAINAVIGACLGDDRLVIRSLDNTSVTVVETTPAGLVLVAAGHEADTLIR